MYFPQLIFTRFVFAFLIFVYHAGRDAFPFNIEVIEILFRVRRATSFFFLLSGFMLTIGYIEKIGKVNFMQYFARRFARIYPVYLLSIVTLLPLYVYARMSDVEITPLIVNLFLVQSWFTTYLLSVNPPGWSLSVLWFFYILFPILLRWMVKMSRMTSIIFTSCLWAASVVSYVVILEMIGWKETTDSHRFFLYSPLLHLNVFIMGIGCGIFYREIREKIDQKKSTLLIVASVALMVVILSFVKNPETRIFQNGLFGPFFVMLIYGLAADRSWLARALSSRVFVALGEISYCMFILQWPVINYTGIILKRLGIAVTTTERFYIVFVVLLAVSFAAYHLVEKPGRRIVMQKMRANGNK